MRTTTLAVPIAMVGLAFAATAPWAATVDGIVRAGGLIVDEVGDVSTVQETYNLYEGFALSQIRLTGTLDPRSTFSLDLRDVNRPSRTGDLVFRVPGRFRLTAAYDQSRHVFDPDRLVTSERKDWRVGMQYTESRWLSLSADVGQVMRDGERLSYPPGTVSVLGNRYDAAITTAQLTADVHRNRRGGEVSFRMTNYDDALNPAADRLGRVVAARFYAPMPFYDKWTNLLRGSYGVRQLRQGDPEHTLAGFQYTAVVQPESRYELRYAFVASRVDDNTTQLLTTRYQNDFDATWYYAQGLVRAGYGYEMNDDDRRLTTYHGWRAGATYRPDRWLNARVDYAGRIKKDQEELTLLKDIEASRVRVKLESQPVAGLTIGGDYTRRERDLPDIGVSVDGTVTGALVRYQLAGWGALSADYSHSTDHYVDLLAPFDTRSDIVTARAEITRIESLRVAGGVAYLDIGDDLDIEKSSVFAEAGWTVARRYHLDVKYNCYNYDDYILINRYYTANVVRIDLGYDLGP